VFEIEYKGANTIVISTKKSRLVSDPKLSLAGLKDIDVKNAVVVATEPRFTVVNAGELLTIEGPGEYEVGDFSIRGISAVRHIDAESSQPAATIYRIEIGEVSLALFGNISSSLSEDQLETIGVVDIAIVPVGGGGYTLDYVAAARLARQIGPKVVIPIHYADSALKYEVPQDSLDLFTSELGAPSEVTTKYKLKSASALPAAMSVIEISRS
jgi:L-ascorbate metabolism protein UlaG (beta-lactamase superfamily)